TRNDVEVPDGPEITALKLELSNFSTSHTSLQMMVQMLRTELADLKWVNNKLQEENESYGLLLMERAMNGTGVEMPRKMGGDASSTLSGIYGDERSITDEAERSSLRSGGRSVLYRVSEDEEFVPEGGHASQIESNSLALELHARQGFRTAILISPTSYTPKLCLFLMAYLLANLSRIFPLLVLGWISLL
ncbi:hypothetical protein JB92DRAFT_2991719, partial [Gautieria morchelliformis]